MTRNRALLIGVVLALLFSVLVLVAATGVRGSDQHWYVADVQTLVDGGPRLTNDLYPRHLLASETVPATPFVHDTLNLYLVLPLAKLLGSYQGWIIANLLSSLLCMALIGHMVLRRSNNWRLGLIASAAYLFYPLTYWQTCQPLIEATTAPFAVVALWLFVIVRHPAKFPLIVLSLGLGLWCRSSFLPLLGLAALLPAWELRHNRSLAIGIVGVSLGLTAAFVLLADSLFHSAMPSSFKSVLLNGLVSGNNMEFLTLPEPSEIPWGAVAAKFAGNLFEQVWPRSLSSQIFYVPFNVLSLLTFVLLFRKNTTAELRKLCLIACAFLAVHLVTILLHQQQPRYMLLTMPILIVCAALFVHQQQVRLKLLPLIVALLAALGILASMTSHLRVESAQTDASRAMIQDLARQYMSLDDKVVLEAANPLVSVSLAPRRVLWLSSSSSPELRMELAKRFPAHWLVRPASETEVDSVPFTQLVETFDVMGQRFELRRYE